MKYAPSNNDLWDKHRVAIESGKSIEIFVNRGKDLLLRPDEFSIEQTNLSSYLAKLLKGNQNRKQKSVGGKSAFFQQTELDGRQEVLWEKPLKKNST